jgi:HK97 family phage prohead protease
MTPRVETRQLTTSRLELRDKNGQPHLQGWASVTETPYPYAFFTETIKRGAFTKTLAANPDVALLVNHDGLPLARTPVTLQLREDDRGLRVDATLDGDDPDVQRILPKVRRGDLGAMSFAFQVTDQQWNDDYDVRDIYGVDLNHGDVSIVTMPANPAAAFSLRKQPSYKERRDAAYALMSGTGRGIPLAVAQARARALRLGVPGTKPPQPKKPNTMNFDTYKARAYALGLHTRRAKR